MSTPAAGCFIVVLAAVLVVVWRRRQRWRRSRPWLAKLRAEAASKMESNKEPVATRPKERPPMNDIPGDKTIKTEAKRTKERRKRGKEIKPRPQPAQPTPPSPRLIPLPLSPVISPTLVLPSTPPPSTPPPKPKLPAFPPASPLPPSLARKPPPLVRKATPSLTSINTAVGNTGSGSNRRSSYVERKGSEQVEFPTLNVKDEPKPKRKPSDAGRKDRARKPSPAPTPESTQIASLKGALEAARLREEEVAEERKAWQKKERELQTQVNQLSHQLHALTIAFATGGGQGFPPYGYGYGTAVDHQAGKPDSEQSYPPMYIPYPYPPFPPGAMTPHAPPMAPMPTTPMISPPPMSPPQAPPYLFSTHPWMHRGASPMHPGHAHGMSSPGGIPMTSPINGMPGRHHFYSGSPRRGGSRLPRRHGTGTPSTPSVGSVDDVIPLPGIESRKSWLDDWARDDLHTTRDDSAHRDGYIPPRDDYVPLQSDYVPIPPPTSGTKREREPETDDDEECSCSDSEDSVIFEDGSVGDSVNLSLRCVERGGEQDVM